MSMQELSEDIYRLRVRKFADDESPTGTAWVIDLLTPDGGELLEESAGVASTLSLAMKEVAGVIDYLINDEAATCSECGKINTPGHDLTKCAQCGEEIDLCGDGIEI